MVVESESLCWLTGRLVKTLDGAGWAEELARLPAVTAVVRDAGTALGKGLRQERARRRAAREPDIEQALDVFHTLREGCRAVRTTWGVARRALERADAAQRRLDLRARQGGSLKGHVNPVRRCWRRAEAAWQQAEAAAAAWGRVREVFELFTPQGRLNDRAHAAAMVAAALPDLKGGAWAKVRRLLVRPESFTFLDQAARRLAGLGLEPEVLSALLDLEGLRRQPWRAEGDRPQAAAVRAWALARSVQLARARPGWREDAAAVRRELRGVWRASSLVECLNSVARMQQARHRKLSQGLLDLKRLWWNLRRFRTGRRKGRSPYELLGLKLPERSLWEVLKLSPDQLRQELSAQGDTS